MQIRNENTRPSDESARSKSQAIDLTRSNRDGIQETVDRARRPDKVDLSKAAEAAEGHIGPDGTRETKEERAERIESLRNAVETGDLNTPERVQKAAQKLLGD